MRTNPEPAWKSGDFRAGERPPVECRGMRIGILVVAYNAVTTLVSVLDRIPEEVWQNVEEVAVFDDASSDSTYELAVGYKTLADRYKLHIIRQPKNLGYGGNQKSGYKYFIDKGFDVVVLLHGDGQYAPEILHHLYAPIVSGEASAVLGSRMMREYGSPLRGGMPLYKFVGNKILSGFENRSLGMNLTEFHSGYRAYSLRALRNVEMSAMTGDFHFDTEIIIKLQHQGYRITEVPIPTYYGDEICYVNGLQYAYNVARAVHRYKSTIRSARKYPEFEEYFVNYPVKEAKHSSHSVVARVLGTNRDVLDLGCGEGFFARALKRDGNRVTGIDVIPVPRHRDGFARYLCANLNDGLAAAAKPLAGATFDSVLMMDVLQHLPNPEGVLREAAAYVRPTGTAIVTLPHVANVTVRAALAFGRFDYTDRGILDRRHLRFFTRGTARAFIESCGYEIVSETPTVMPLEFVFGLSAKHPVTAAVHGLLSFVTAILPSVFAYQWVFVARPTRADS